MDKPGLYIHIPFCRSKCPYCGFYSTTALEGADIFLKSLIKEMEIYSRDFREFDTIYIGGGTPTTLPISNLEIIVEEAVKKFLIPDDAEITLEANPADVSFHEIKTLRALGINRLNLGIQSFDDRMLALLGRRHNSIQAFSALDNAVKGGFDNCGLDLIYGIPGQEMSSWTDTLRTALTFNPAHVSCYQLTLEPGTPLAVKEARGETAMPGEAFMADLFFETDAVLTEAGYLHYEVSNYAGSIGLQSRHNQKYWNHTPYLGLGPSAHSYREGRRWWNHRSLARYIDDLKRGKAPVDASETLTPDQMELETLFLGLRTASGVRLEDFESRFNHDLLTEKGAAISMLVQKRLLEIKEGALRPTPAGLAMADSLALI